MPHVFTPPEQNLNLTFTPSPHLYSSTATFINQASSLAIATTLNPTATLTDAVPASAASTASTLAWGGGFYDDFEGVGMGVAVVVRSESKG